MRIIRIPGWARLAVMAAVWLTAAGGSAQAATRVADFEAVARGPHKLFVPAAAVKKAYDAGARFLIVDARAPQAYARAHIKGAINVPFYDVARHQAELPKDEWIVTYCACPHAEAVAAARTLFKLGYSRVKVLDEGFSGWRLAGYPVIRAKP